MRARPLVWLVVLCLVLIAFVILRRQVGSRSPQANGAQGPSPRQAQTTEESPQVEPRPASPASPAPAREAHQGVPPRLDPVAPVRNDPGQAQAGAIDGTNRATAPTAPRLQEALAPNLQPEPEAEVWSYAPLLQQNAATNFMRVMEKLANAKTEQDRYLVLGEAARLAFLYGRTNEARNYARELLSLDQRYLAEPWRGGGAVHDGNLVLGRIAVHEGQTEQAKQHLLEAGRSPGSPVLESFGPNMCLARDLLQRGETETVLGYFELCRKFWGLGNEKLAQWTADVQAGRMPDFGANLLY